MRPRDAVRSAARYHLRAFVPTAVGAGVAGVGLWYGLRSAGSVSPAALAASGRIVPTALLVVAGLLVVAFGRTAARHAITADIVAAEVEAARSDDDGLDPDDVRETVSLAVQHAVADTMDVASDEITDNVEEAVSRALEDGNREAPDDSARRVVDPTGEREVRGVPDDAPVDGPVVDPLAGPNGGDEDESRDPLAEASRRASERMDSLLDEAHSEFPDEVAPGEADDRRSEDGAEILTDDGGDDDSRLPDGSETDDAEIIDGDRNGGETAGEAEDAEMVFGAELKDAE